MGDIHLHLLEIARRLNLTIRNKQYVNRYNKWEEDNFPLGFSSEGEVGFMLTNLAAEEYDFLAEPIRAHPDFRLPFDVIASTSRFTARVRGVGRRRPLRRGRCRCGRWAAGAWARCWARRRRTRLAWRRRRGGSLAAAAGQRCAPLLVQRPAAGGRLRHAAARAGGRRHVRVRSGRRRRVSAKAHACYLSTLYVVNRPFAVTTAGRYLSIVADYMYLAVIDSYRREYRLNLPTLKLSTLRHHSGSKIGQRLKCNTISKNLGKFLELLSRENILQEIGGQLNQTKGRLVALLTDPDHHFNIDTLEQLAASGLPICEFRNAFSLFKDVITAKSADTLGSQSRKIKMKPAKSINYLNNLPECQSHALIMGDNDCHTLGKGRFFHYRVHVLKEYSSTLLFWLAR
ncbi:Protein of unknown function, partial [Gryllus bimaculatus]